MATFQYIKETNQSIAAMKGLISYCTQDKKVRDVNVKDIQKLLRV